VAAFLVVAGLDLARAYVGTGLRPVQWAAGLAVVVLLWRWLEERGFDRRARGPWVALALLLVPTYVDHARVLDRGDSVHYYAHLRSLLFDGDLEQGNDHVLLGYPEAESIPNVLPVGAPLFWSPLVLFVHALRQAARAFGLGPPTGAEPAYQATVTLATLLYGSAALFLLMDALRRWVGPWAAFWATVVAWVGSPLRFYLAVLPGTAHGVEFFAAVLVLRASLALRERPDTRRAALAGAACGLAFLARSQDGLLLIVPAVLAAFAGQAIGARSVARAWLAIGAAFAVVAVPQLAVWQAMFGAPVLIPHRAIHGDQFLHAARPELLGVLVSERGGLFASHPMTVVALIGLVLLARRDGRYAAAVAPVLLATWYLNASVFDWYHVRRYTGIVPLIAPGLAVALAPLAAWPVAGAVLAFVVLRYDVAVDTLRSVPGDPAPVRAVVKEMGDGLAADTYAAVEPVAPGVAVRMMAAYTGQPASGRAPVRIDVAGEAVARLPVRARNLSAPSVHEGVACRWVRGDEARVFVAMVPDGPIELKVTAAPAEPGRNTELAVAWNGIPLGAQPMTAGWGEYRYHVPAAFLRPGTNQATLSIQRPGDRRREVRRSAAISSLVVDPGP
jgi:hypothetical protein